MSDIFDETMLLMGFEITRKKSATHYKYAGPPRIFVSVPDKGALLVPTPRCYVDIQGSPHRYLASSVHLIADRESVLEVITNRLRDERELGGS